MTYSIKTSFNQFTSLWFIDIRKKDLDILNRAILTIKEQQTFNLSPEDSKKLSNILKHRKEFIYKNAWVKFKNDIDSYEDKDERQDYKNFIIRSIRELEKAIKDLLISFNEIKGMITSSLSEKKNYDLISKFVASFSIDDQSFIKNLRAEINKRPPEKNAIILLHHYWGKYNDKNRIDIYNVKEVSKKHNFGEEAFTKAFNSFPAIPLVNPHPNKRIAYIEHYKYILPILKEKCPEAFNEAERDYKKI